VCDVAHQVVQVAVVAEALVATAAHRNTVQMSNSSQAHKWFEATECVKPCILSRHNANSAKVSTAWAIYAWRYWRPLHMHNLDL
jgi:hypothetical protein